MSHIKSVKDTSLVLPVLNGKCLFVMFTHCTSVQKEWCVGFHYRNDKESHTFQRQKPLILQHDVDTYVLLTYVSSFSINQRSVSLYELVTKKS